MASEMTWAFLEPSWGLGCSKHPQDLPGQGSHLIPASAWHWGPRFSSVTVLALNNHTLRDVSSGHQGPSCDIPAWSLKRNRKGVQRASWGWCLMPLGDTFSLYQDTVKLRAFLYGESKVGGQISLASFPHSWHSSDFTAPCGPHHISVDRNCSPPFYT